MTHPECFFTCGRRSFLARLLFLTASLLTSVCTGQDLYKVVFDSYYSVQLNRTVPFYVLLPPGYDSTSERYPAVYLLRGAASEWISPNQDIYRLGRDLTTVADTLYKRGSMGKMVFVLPELSQPGTAPEIHALATEMFAHVDSVYRTIPTRWHRGVDGFSYGGLDAMNLVMDRPEALSTAGSYDGSYFLFDMGKITSADTAEVQILAGIRFMQHSGEGSNTNEDNVRTLVQVLNSRGLQNEFSELRLLPGAQHNWWYADEHTMITLPLHWSTFHNAPHSIQTAILTPSAGGKVAGVVPVSWSADNAPAGAQYYLEYSDNKGKSWHVLSSGAATTTESDWNTSALADGAWYALRLSVTADTAYGQTEFASTFTIDNPGNGAPAVELLSPGAGSTVAGVTNIQWEASDAEGDSLIFLLELSSDGGITWEPIASDLHGVTQYLWDSRLAPNCTDGKLRIQCSDGQSAGFSVASRVSIANIRQSIPSNYVQHRSGNGDGIVFTHVINAQAVKPDFYEVTFSSDSGRAHHFNVRDLNRDTVLISEARMPGAGNEGPEFDGLRLEISQPESPTYSPDSSRWLLGQSNFKPTVTLPTFNTSGGKIVSVAYPADYLITVADHVVDTSASYLDLPATPMMFTVWNLPENRKERVVFSDLDGDFRLSMFDEIILLEPGPDPIVTWDLFYPLLTTPIPPGAGDTYFLKILKPFTSRDTVVFVPIIDGVTEPGVSLQPARLTLLPNYPNPFNPSTNIEFEIAHQERVKVTIFNLLGQRIVSLWDGTLASGRHKLQWDGSTAATGVYFLRIEAGGQVATRRMLLLR
jgi:enterochelin esterase-like enzyme